jgi:hypothetical protein
LLILSKELLNFHGKITCCRPPQGQLFMHKSNCSDEQWIIKFSWQEHVAARHKVNCSCTNQIAQILIVLTVPSRPNKIVQILIVYSLVACFIIWLLIAIPCNISILSQIRAFILYCKKIIIKLIHYDLITLFKSTSNYNIICTTTILKYQN